MDGWVTVSRGPVWQVQLEAGRLADEGIESWVPDETIKIMDPFATGGLPLHTELKVREEHALEARALIDDIAGEGPDESELTEAALATPPDPDLGITPAEAVEAPLADEAEDDAATRERIETLARRTRWAALAMITLPFAAWFGAQYVRESRRTGIRDMKHGLTIASLVLGVFTALGAGAMWSILSWHA